jgi:hypothetical protein
VVATIRLCLGDDVMYHVMDKESSNNLVEIGKSVYVKVVDEQALSKAAVVRLEDGGWLRFESTHQRVQSDNRRFKRVDVKFEDEDKALMLHSQLFLRMRIWLQLCMGERDL